MQDPNKNLKIAVIILLITAIALSGLLVYRHYAYLQLQKNSVAMKSYLENEKDSLRGELVILRNEYDTLSTDNDSMQLKLDMQKEKIDNLLKLRADNVYQIHLFKKELITLRSVMRNYVIQIDSLNTLNQQLIAENTEVKNKLTEVESSAKQLKEEKESLSGKVSKAEILSAKNISAVGLNQRSKERDRIGQIEKLRVCFTIRENPIAEAGKRIIHLRITRPDESIITKSETQVFTTPEDEPMIYSEKRMIQYDNKDIEACIYYDIVEGELIEGGYQIELFSEGNLIGETSLSLKEGGFLGL